MTPLQTPRVFIDTNALVDMMMPSRSGHPYAQRIFHVIATRRIRGFITTQSIIDASYILTQRNMASLEVFKRAVHAMHGTIEWLSIEPEDIDRAIRFDLPDFEDAAQLSCALNNGCDYIISSDRKYSRYTDLPVYTPAEFCDILFGQD